MTPEDNRERKKDHIGWTQEDISFQRGILASVEKVRKKFPNSSEILSLCDTLETQANEIIEENKRQIRRLLSE